MENMENEKKLYEEPTVKMVEFDFSERIAASNCGSGPLPVDCNEFPW